MFGNGVQIGMEIITQAHKITRKVLRQARSVFCVAVVGTTMPSTAVRLIGSTTRLLIAATTSGFVW